MLSPCTCQCPLTSVPLYHTPGVDVNGSDAVYTTALQVAAASGHESLVQLLAQRGASLEAANLYGWTPLMHAARHGHAGVVRLLLQRGADVRRCNRLGACWERTCGGEGLEDTRGGIDRVAMAIEHNASLMREAR